ncbi:hypothetical protein D3C80_1745570 [compost metagenome]
MNKPMMPLVTMPPRAPISTTGIGTATPRPSSIGFSTLSDRPATKVQTAKAMVTAPTPSWANT